MKIKIAIIIAISFVLLMAGFAVAKEAEYAKNISPKQAYDMMQKDSSVYVIDVRTPWEFQFLGHIVNAYKICKIALKLKL